MSKFLIYNTLTLSRLSIKIFFLEYFKYLMIVHKWSISYGAVSKELMLNVQDEHKSI